MASGPDAIVVAGAVKSTFQAHFKSGPDLPSRVRACTETLCCPLLSDDNTSGDDTFSTHACEKFWRTLWKHDRKFSKLPCQKVLVS